MVEVVVLLVFLSLAFLRCFRRVTSREKGRTVSIALKPSDISLGVIFIRLGEFSGNRSLAEDINVSLFGMVAEQSEDSLQETASS